MDPEAVVWELEELGLRDFWGLSGPEFVRFSGELEDRVESWIGRGGWSSLDAGPW